MSLRTEIEKLLAPLRHKVSTIISKAIVQLVNDDNGFQILQVSLGKGEIQDNLERIQEYGFTSYPDEEAEAIVAFIGGNRNQGIIIKVDDHRYRLIGIGQGSVAIYSKGGNRVVLKANGDIEVHANGKCDIEGTEINLGSSNLKKLVHEGILSIMSAHIHNFPATGGAPTTPAIYTPPLSTALHATTKVKGE